jgi:hypothetical protein
MIGKAGYTESDREYPPSLAVLGGKFGVHLRDCKEGEK